MRKSIHVLKNTFVHFVLGLFLLGSAQANAEEILSITVSGTVVDETDQPLVGVNILEKGTMNGAVTDRDGKFTLAVESEKSVLMISYIGYAVQETTVNNLTTINIKLIPDIATLSEIVVVGYGTTKRQDVITSIASVKPETLTKNASLDIGEMMRGKVAGVYITTNDAGPGGSSRIQIRGQSSLSAGSDPLVIADGIQIGSINDINPADIESMDILKDAAAQAIYGARAANGVILITTKRGKTDKITINYDGYYGTQTAKRNFDVYTGQEFAQLKREADRAVNGNIMRADAVIFSADELAAIAENRSIDWSDEVMKPATIQNHNISFSAGSEKTKVYFGTNYQNMTGIVPTTKIERTTVRLNLDQTLTKWLTVGVNTSFQLSLSSDPDVAGIVRQVVTASPLGNIYNADGSYNVRPGGNQESFNPLLNLNQIDNSKNARNDIVNVFVDISPIKGFNNRINLSRRSWNNKELNYNSKLSESGVANGAANGFIYYQENAEWQLENISTYKTSIQDHNFNFTLVESAIESNYYDFRNTSSQIPNDILGIYGLSSALINVPTIGGNQRRLLSIAGRVEYDYLSKYSIGITARAD
nr:SusC/RagA family TonB-linked outer membrane protein [Chryseolinea sp.]